MAEKPVRDVLDDDVDDLPGDDVFDPQGEFADAGSTNEPAGNVERVDDGSRGEPTTTVKTDDQLKLDDGTSIVIQNEEDEPAPPARHVEEGANAEGGDDAVDVDGADQLEEEDRSYSKRVQARILREKRVTEQARQEAEQERTQRVEAQRKVYLREKQLAGVLTEQVKLKIDNVKRELAAAEAGEDVSKKIELQTQLQTLLTEQREIEGAARALEKEPQFDTRPVRNPYGDNWRAHNRWFQHPRFKSESLHLQKINSDMLTEIKNGSLGLSVQSQAYFDELSRRVKEEMPDLAVKVRTVFKPQPVKEAARRQTVAAPTRTVTTRVSGQERNNGARAGQVVLGKKDFEAMRDFKLDPNNPAHLKQWAKTKREAENGSR